MKVRVWSRVVAPLLGVCVVVGLSTPARADAGWTQVGPTTPGIPSPDGTLSHIGCAAADRCLAIGETGAQYIGQGAGTPFALSWNGTRWRAAPPPARDGARAVLQDVACTAGSSCLVAGWWVLPTGRHESLALRWDGTAWADTSPVSDPTLDTELLDVQCTVATACLATGRTLTHRGRHTIAHSYVERFDGTAWATRGPISTAFPNRLGCGPTRCVSVTAIVVASSLPSKFAAAGTPAGRWSSVPFDLPPSDQSDIVTAVSCAADDDCTVVGSRRDDNARLDHPWIERWDGTTWAPATPHTAPDNARFVDVSCVRGGACVALGRAIRPRTGASVSFAQRWDGRAWRDLPVPRTTVPYDSDPAAAVACVAASDCTAVGTVGLQFGSTVPRRPWAARWDGSAWAVQTTPNGRADFGHRPTAVSCPTPDRCVAVGTYQRDIPYDSGAWQAVWNGSTWSAATLNLPDFYDAELTSVSCPTTTWCLAVGYGYRRGPDGTTETGIAATWDGTTWTRQPVPASTITEANAVSCVSPSECAVVGVVRNPYSPAALRWNGTRLTALPTALPAGSDEASLQDVACPRSGWCVTVGDSGGGTPHALTGVFDDGRWQLAPLADGLLLSAVDCDADGSCLAVGYTEDDRRRTAAAAYVGDGVTWTRDSSVPRSSHGFTEVDCHTGACTAILDEAPADRTAAGWTVGSFDAPRDYYGITLDCDTAGTCTALSGTAFLRRTAT